MDKSIAKPALLKQLNIAQIRKIMKSRATVTRAEIVEETKISVTTVRALLCEMLENGEIESIGHDESSGGRKAERYRFLPDRYFGVAFCIANKSLRAVLLNLNGEIVETTTLVLKDENYNLAIQNYLDSQIATRDIKAIGIGVPGLVEGSGYWAHDIKSENLYYIEIGEDFERQYGLPIVLENDLNATAIGFGKCYEKKFPQENPENTNMAYLHFEKGCVSAGLIAGGNIIRGSNNFAGEIGLVPIDGEKPLNTCMMQALDAQSYIKLVSQTLCWVCGILNPKYIALGGTDFRKECLADIGELLYSILPKQMKTEIVYADDLWHDYCSGMAFLTAEKMFDTNYTNSL